MGRLKIIMVFYVIFFLVTGNIYSAVLDSSDWEITAPGNGNTSAVVDNDLSTIWDSGSPQSPGTAIIIDLKKPAYVYRVFLTCGDEVARMARSLIISVGQTKDSFKQVAAQISVTDENNKCGAWKTTFHSEANFMFSPVLGRYVKIELGRNTSGLSWAVAELSIHGAQKIIPKSEWFEVVLDKDAKPTESGKRSAWAETLYAAACDLQYYLMELLNQPVGLCYSDNIPETGKLKFCLMTPPKEKIPIQNPNQADLDDISVVKKGNEVVFSGLTARAVAYGVYEFLYSQGVRWLYPDSYGDNVTSRQNLDLSVLPLKYSPPFKTRFPLAASSNGAGRPYLARTKHAERFFLRTGANAFQKNGPLMGIPPRKNIKGSFHSFMYIFPPEVEKAHPEWWKGPYRMKRGANARHGSSGLNPCTSSPEVCDYIVKWIEKDYEARKKSGKRLYQGYSVMPLDSAVFCECERCTKLFGKVEKINPKGSDVYWNLNYSDHFFYLINEVAKKIKAKYPELSIWTCAYAQYLKPPQKIKKLSDNVIVDLCVSKAYFDLPLDASKNREVSEIIKTWSEKCSSMGVIEYGLIQSDTTFSTPLRNVPTFSPLATSISNWHKQQKEMGIKAIGAFTMGNMKRLPWAMYIWSRTAWNPDDPVDNILHDFFTGYYGTAAGEKMLKIYKMVENKVISGGVSMRDLYHNNYAPSPKVFTKELKIKIKPLIAEAMSAADTWYRKERVKQAKDSLEWSFRAAQKGFGNETYPCYKVPEAPVIDGRLDEPAWASLPVYKGLYIYSADTMYKNQGKWALIRPTQFRIGWDSKYVYLAVECTEPDMAKINKVKNKAQEQLVVIWGQNRNKFNRWPLTFRFYLPGQSASKQRGLDEYKFSKQKDKWILEAKFLQKNLAPINNMPAEGVEWLFNMRRYVSQRTLEDTWKQFSWSPTYHANHFNYHLWLNHIIFHDKVLSGEEAAEISRNMNLEHDAFVKRYASHQVSQKAFEKRFKGKPNLLTKQNRWHFLPMLPLRFFNRSWQPIQLIARSDTPITIDGIKILWHIRGLIREWYSVEYWDGKRYKLLYETRKNAFHINCLEFTPVTTSRLRITVYGDRTGNIDGWPSSLIKNVEAFSSKK